MNAGFKLALHSIGRVITSSRAALCRWIESQRKLRDVWIVVILQERKSHNAVIVCHLNDDRNGRDELREGFGDTAIVRCDEGESPEDQTLRLEVGDVLQELDGMAQFAGREGSLH